MMYYLVHDIRNVFLEEYYKKNFVIDKTGVKTVEILGASFKADEDWILRTSDKEYIKKELRWYKSKSLNVNDIEPPIPKIWKDVAAKDGSINTNYGWCIFSKENGHQYENALNELIKNKFSRRASMIYNRPSIWYDYKINGMSDYICTYSNQFFIRDNKLISYYLMRSQDVVMGFNNDVAWARYVHQIMFYELKGHYPDLEIGDLLWSVGSLHVYETNFYCFEYYFKTGKWPNSIEDYKKLIGESNV